MNLKEKAQKLIQSKDEEARIDIIAKCLTEIKYKKKDIKRLEAKIKEVEDGGDVSDYYYEPSISSSKYTN